MLSTLFFLFPFSWNISCYIYNNIQQEVVPNEDHQKPLTSMLEELTLIDLPELMIIWFGPNAIQILSFQHLQHLVVDGLKETKFIFSKAVLRSLSKLTSLVICNCEELVKIIAENEESKNFAPNDVFFPKLNTLEIERCHKLKSLFSIPIEVGTVLPNLTVIRLRELQSFVNIYRGFIFSKLKLQTIEVDGCPKFTPIFGATQTIPLDHRTEVRINVLFSP